MMPHMLEMARFVLYSYQHVAYHVRALGKLSDTDMSFLPPGAVMVTLSSCASSLVTKSTEFRMIIQFMVHDLCP